MYPSRFRYEAPRSLAEAIGLLHDGGDYAKVLAGGQSLVPLMKLRFASPELVVDINNVPGLDYHRADPDGTLRIGALCRHVDLERSDLLKTTQPTMASAAPLIADPIVRNRGTLVGSLCHADPQGDWASVVLALGGSVVARGPGGMRAIPLADFVTGPFQNVLDQDEIAVEAVIPAAQGNPLRRLPQARAPRGRLRDRRGRGRAGDERRDRDPGGHRADRGGRLHHRGHRGRRRADRAAADRRQHRPGCRPRRAGRPAQDRSSRQRRIQAAHGAHVRRAPAEPDRRGGGKGSVTMTIVYEDQDGQAASDIPARRIKFSINGEKMIAEVEPRLLLAHLIRRGLGLTGTHMGCDTTNCGACTVLVDGRPVKSCTMLAVQADGHEISTVEGLATASELHPLQEGFKEEHGLQCGFCTPGMMMAAKALLDANPDPTEEDVRWALSGNLCRCTGYQNIVKSVLWAAAKLRAESGS